MNEVIPFNTNSQVPRKETPLADLSRNLQKSFSLDLPDDVWDAYNNLNKRLAALLAEDRLSALAAEEMRLTAANDNLVAGQQTLLYDACKKYMLTKRCLTEEKTYPQTNRIVTQEDLASDYKAFMETAHSVSEFLTHRIPTPTTSA